MKKIFEHRNYAFVMLLSILLYSLTLISSETLAKNFRFIFIIGSLPIFFYHRNVIFKDPMIKLFGLILIIQLASWLNSYIFLPDIANSIPKMDRLSKLFLFLFIAYWLKGSMRNVFLLWATLTIGFIIGCFVHVDFFNEINRAMSGVRVDFAIKNAQFTSMFSGVSILISIFFLSQILFNKKLFNTLTNNSKILLSISIVIAFLFFLFMTIVTQSRQVWLALSITLILLPIFYAFIYPSSKKKLIIISYLMISLIFIALSLSSTVKNRVLKESETLQTIVAGDFDNIPMTSIGIRVNSWIAALEWIKDRPIIGSGPEAIAEVIQQSDKFTGKLKNFGHLHNYHIETLVAYGVVGLILIYTLYYWLARSLFIKKRKQPELTDITFFCLVFIIFWALINLFETFNGRSYGVYVHNIMFAGFYTFYLTPSLNQRASK